MGFIITSMRLDRRRRQENKTPTVISFEFSVLIFELFATRHCESEGRLGTQNS